MTYAFHGGIHGDVDLTTDDDVLVDGDIDKGGHPSRVRIVSNQGSITVRGKIDGQSVVDLHARGGVFVGDKIDGQSRVWLRSDTSDIEIVHKIDGQSTVRVEANGSIRLFTKPPAIFQENKIDGGCDVALVAGGTLTADGRVSGSSKLQAVATGAFQIGSVQHGATAYTRNRAQNTVCNVGGADGSATVVYVGSQLAITDPDPHASLVREDNWLLVLPVIEPF